MTLEAAPTPCSRTGFHMSTSSLYAPGLTIIKSPGCAASIAAWIVGLSVGTWVGALPPIVTVTVSTDCLPLPAVIRISPHFVLVAPGAYCACCCKPQSATPEGTVTTIWLSLQLVMGAVTPPMVTLDKVLHVALPAVGLVH